MVCKDNEECYSFKFPEIDQGYHYGYRHYQSIII